MAIRILENWDLVLVEYGHQMELDCQNEAQVRNGRLLPNVTSPKYVRGLQFTLTATHRTRETLTT